MEELIVNLSKCKFSVSIFVAYLFWSVQFTVLYLHFLFIFNAEKYNAKHLQTKRKRGNEIFKKGDKVKCNLGEEEGENEGRVGVINGVFPYEQPKSYQIIFNDKGEEIWKIIEENIIEIV